VLQVGDRWVTRGRIVRLDECVVRAELLDQSER